MIGRKAERSAELIAGLDRLFCPDVEGQVARIQVFLLNPRDTRRDLSYSRCRAERAPGSPAAATAILSLQEVLHGGGAAA